MSEEEKELIVKQLMVNQQLLKAIILLMCPNREDGKNVIKECQNNIEMAFQYAQKKMEAQENEIQTN